MKNLVTILAVLLAVLFSFCHVWSQEPPGLAITQAKVEPASATPWKKVLISCHVFHGRGPMQIARVGAALFHGDLVTVYPVLYDDGTHGDMTSGDGVYSVEIQAGETPCDQRIIFSASDKSRNEIESEPIILKVR